MSHCSCTGASPFVVAARFFGIIVTLLFAATSRADEYDTLRLKWFDAIIGTGYDTSDATVVSRLNSIAGAGNSNWSSMDKSPARTFLWSDLASTTISSHINENYNRLRAMAIAYATPGCSLAGNAALLSDTISGLDWMYANRYNPTKSIYSNWWDFEIGAPYRLMDIVVLLYDHLTPTQITNYTNAVEKFTPSASTPAPGGTTGTFTGANRMWKIRVVAVRGAVVKDSAKLTNARDSFSQLFVYATSGDGFYADGSFIQHDYLAYTAGYGETLLLHMMPVFSWLSGSSWAVTDPAQGNMYQWVYDSFEPIVYRGAAWDSVRGRGFSSPTASPQAVGHSIMNSILQMAQFAPPADAARMKSMIKEWALSDTVRDFVSQRPLPTLALAKALMNDPGVIRRGELTGHFQFPAMDRVVHLGKGYGFGLSMCSTRISNFESINDNNLKGWLTGDGMTILYNADLDAFTDAYAPTVDAYRMPGVTADVTHNKFPHTANSIGLRAQGQDTLSPHSWVGGAKLGNYGAAGMQFKGVGVTLTGKKSWFMFDDEVVCLGAGITSTDNRPIETTVENRKLDSAGSNAFTVNGVAKSNIPGWSEAMTGVNWAHLAGTASTADIGYYFPQPAAITAVREARAGAWADVDAGSSTAPITRNYLRMGFEHGSNPSNATYRYVLLPGRTAKRVGQYAAAPQITVLNNNANVQAVRENTLGITAANFWTDATQTAGGITANKKCSVLVRDDGTFIDVAVSDPTQTNTGSIALQIALDGGTLVSADAGVTVTQSSPTISLGVSMAGARGKTFKARFYKLTPQTVNLTPVADSYVYDKSDSVDLNFGTQDKMVVKKAGPGFNREAFLRFELPTGNGILLGGTLNLPCISLAVPGINAVAKVDDNSWIETDITWNFKPEAGPVLGTWTPIAAATSSVDVTSALPASGPVSFKVHATTETSNGIVNYGTRENATPANRPQLVLIRGNTPPEVTITSPADGDVISNAGTITLTAEAVPTDGAVTSVSFYSGPTLLGSDVTAPYSITTTLAGGSHILTAVATDSNALSRTSLANAVDVIQSPFVPTAITWDAGGGDSNWATVSNWSDGAAANGDHVTFNLTGAAVSDVTNTVAASISIASLTHSHASATLQHSTHIAAGQTLAVDGNFRLSGAVDAAIPTNLTITGNTGTLTVTGTEFQVGQTTPTANTTTNSLDMSGLGNFTANLGESGVFRLGATSTTTAGALATVKLANTSSITAGILGVGDRAGRGGTHALKLGSTENTLHANTISVGPNAGGGRGNGDLSFETSTGTLKLRAADGTSAVDTVNLINTSFGTSNNLTATANFAGHAVDARIGTLTMARRNSTGSVANATATLSFDAGTLEVGTLDMAVNSQPGSTSGAINATLTIGGGSATFDTITMATSSGGGSATTNATLNLTGGTTTVSGDITKGGGAATTATVILNGGTLDMTAGNIGSLANPVTLTLESGTLKNVAQINGGGDLIKTSAGTLVLTGINTYTGNTIIGQGILSITTPDFADASIIAIGTLSSPGTATLDLPNPGNDTVASLIINGVVQAPGRTYGNATSVFPVIATSAITGPGTISVPPGPVTPYTQWADSFLTADVSSPSGDNDQDGLTNQQEFAFGLDPLDGSSVNPILVQLDKTNGTFTYRRRAGTGLTYRILTSTSLTANSWTEDTAATSGQVTTPAGINETVVVTLTGAPFTAPGLFVRVAAE